MKTLIAAAVTVALLVGCGQRPGPYLSCENVTSAECDAAHEEAVTSGLFPNGEQVLLTALVRPTEYRFCDGSAEPLFDVSFQLRDRSEPLVVTVGKTASGNLVVCTY